MFVLIGILFILCIYLLWSRRHLYALSWKLPGPPALPLLGNVLSLWNINENVNYFNRISRKYDSPTRLWLGPDLYVFVHDAKTAETVLRNRHCVNKSKVYNAVRDGLGGDGLFTLKGNDWRFHRRLISPTLSDSTVFEHLTIFNRYIKDFTAKLADQVDQPAFDILIPLNVCTLTMYLDATIGMEWEHRAKYAHHFNQALTSTSKRLYRPWYQIDWIWKLTNYEKKVSDFRNFSNEILDGIIQRACSSKNEKYSFIEKLIDVSEENKNFTIDDIKVETHTLLIGASDTTSLSVSTVILMLAMHPQHQDTAYRELLDVMPSDDVEPTSDTLNRLKFLEMCIRESLRLLPTVPLIGRTAVESVRLGDVVVPAGTQFVIGIKQIQVREEYWGPDANSFNPYRFEKFDSNKLKENQCAFMPFSFGPRNCIGYTYGMYTMKTILSYIIRSYHLSTPLQMTDLKLRLSISYRLLNKHMIQLHKREETQPGINKM